MSLFSKLGSLGYGLISSKGVTKTVGKAVTRVGGNSKIIKTTAQTLGSQVPAIAGGKPIRKVIARTTSRGLGKVVKITGKASIPILATGAAVAGGTKVYDYIQDVRSKTPEQRQAEDAFDLFQDIQTEAKKPSISENDPSAVGDDGGKNFFNFYDDLKDTGKGIAGEEGRSSGLMTGLLVAGAIGGGLYFVNKKGYLKKSKKSTKK